MRHPSPARILIIDADALGLTSLAAILHHEGYECLCAQDAEAAWKAVRCFDADLIICDVELGDWSGLDLVRAMRQERPLRDLPILFLAGRDWPEIVSDVRQAGGTYFLRRPLDPRVLVELVDKVLWMPRTMSAIASPPHHVPAMHGQPRTIGATHVR